MLRSLFCVSLVVFSCSALSAPLVLDKQLLQERAAFSLGVDASKVKIEESDRKKENMAEFFNAIYDGKKYQCQVSYLKSSVSNAECRPTDGSDLPKIGG